MLTMQPDRVAVEPLFDPDMIGSIIVPDQAKERCKQGLVKYIGRDVKLVQVGDHVLFGGYTGTLLQVQDEGLMFIMPEEFVVAIVHDDPIEIPNLYFKAKDGTYFNATHEMALAIIASNMQGHTSLRSITMHYSAAHGSPSVSDYDKLR